MSIFVTSEIAFTACSNRYSKYLEQLFKKILNVDENCLKNVIWPKDFFSHSILFRVTLGGGAVW